VISAGHVLDVVDVLLDSAAETGDILAVRAG